MASVKSIKSNLGKFDLDQFLQWWLGQLLSVFPISLQRLFHAHKGYVRFQITEDKINVIQQQGGKTDDPHKFSIPTDVLQSLPPGHVLTDLIMGNFNPHSTCIEICLDPDTVLYTDLTFPIEVEENLAEVLKFEMDDYSPFKPEQAYFHYKITDRDQHKIHLQVALISRKAIHLLQQQVNQWGINEDAIYLLMPSEDFFSSANKSQINLIPIEKRPLKNALLGNINRLLMAMVIILTFATLFIPVLQKYQLINYLENDVNRLQAIAKDVRKLKNKLIDITRLENTLINKKNQSHLVLTSIDELTRVLDDKTWVANFAQNAKGIDISGFAPTASKIIEKIEKSTLLENAVFRSAITKMNDNQYERFSVSTDFETRTTSETRQ